MTEQEVFERLCPLISEVTGFPPESIRMQHVLMMDLGAESLDLLDLSFLIEAAFAIRLESDEFERHAKQRMPGQPYERDGFITEEALGHLRVALPELDPRRLAGPLRKIDLPSILTVSVFVHLIQRKLAAQAEAGAHA